MKEYNAKHCPTPLEVNALAFFYVKHTKDKLLCSEEFNKSINKALLDESHMYISPYEEFIADNLSKTEERYIVKVKDLTAELLDSVRASYREKKSLSVQAINQYIYNICKNISNCSVRPKTHNNKVVINGKTTYPKIRNTVIIPKIFGIDDDIFVLKNE